MNAQTNVPAQRREPAPLIVLKQQLEKRADEFRLALPSHIKPADLQRTVLMAAQQNPTLLGADRRSLILSCMKAAQDGLLPDGREAALVPFSTREKDDQGKWHTVQQVQYMPMVYGLRKKIMQSDEISVMQVGVVYRAEYESGRFLYELGMEPPIRYRPDLDLSDEQSTDDEIVAAFSLVKFKDGSWSADVMRRSEINKIRQLSQTGAVGRVYQFGPNKGKPIEPKGPWVDHFAEMAKKTVMRRHSKVLPMSGDIFRDVEGEEIDRAAQSAVAVLDSVEPDAPVALPGRDELDEQIDTQTGEVIENRPGTDSRGVTEVDEDTARRLDAGEADDDDHEDIEADFISTNKPNGARAGQTWFNPDDEKLRYAHETKNGVKWYLRPPERANDGTLSEDNPTAAEGPADEDRGERHNDADVAEAAAQTMQDIDGPLEQAGEDTDDKPAWHGPVEKVRRMIAAAADEASRRKADDEFQKIAAGLPDDIYNELNAALIDRQRELRKREG